MRSFIQVMGTRGDVEIFLLLGREMASRGHDVTLGTSPFYESKVRGAGLGWAAVGDGELSDLLAVMRGMSGIADQRRRVDAYVRRWLEPQLRAGMGTIRECLASADYVVNNLKTVWKRGGQFIPAATVMYDPPATPERVAQYGPRRVPHGGVVLEIAAMSKPLVDPLNQWPADVAFTGFWSPEPRSWTPPTALEEFIEAGDPPVVLTMGSMVMFDPDRLLEIFEAALALANRRAVVIAGWARLGQRDRSEDRIFFADEVPYEWLFPRAGCVVHHGGCGTVSSVLRAG